MTSSASPNTSATHRPYVPRISRIFASVNIDRDPSYWDYQLADIHFDDATDYRTDGLQLGAGATAMVVAATRHPDGHRVAIKQLVDRPSSRIKLEIQTLRELAGGPNIIRLLAVIRGADESVPAQLVFEHVNDMPPHLRLQHLDAIDVRHYTYELACAVHHCHRHGIMHRDLKPSNVLIDAERRRLRLIDLGVAEFYTPGTHYSTCVGTFFYRAPELLLGYATYDYAVDMWAFGCVLATMTFGVSPFFSGCSDGAQLANIADVAGGRALRRWARAYGIKSPYLHRFLLPEEPRPWASHVTPANQRMVSDELLDLLGRLLVADPYKRLTAEQAMQHVYFAGPRDHQ